MKKLLSLLLTAIMVVSAIAVFPVTAVETDDQTTDTGTANTTPEILAESGSVGALIADAVDRSQDTDDSNAEDIITGITVEESAATVSLSNRHACKVLVGIYDEDSDELLVYGVQQNIAPNTDTVTVTLSGDIPQFFYLRGFILDAENCPLHSPYESDEYTESFYDFINKTVNDFPEEDVINLDEDDDSNYIVLDEDVIRADGDDHNTVDSYGGGIYHISNIDSRVGKRKKGDIICLDKDGEPQIVKIESITVNGSEADITADDSLSLEEALSHAEIDTEAVSSDKETKTTEPSEPIDKPAYDVPIAYSHEFPVSKTFGSATVTGGLTIGLDFHLKIYIEDKSIRKVSLTGTSSAGIYVSVSGELNKDIYITAFEIPTSIPGVFVGTELSLLIEADAEIRFELTVVGHEGFVYQPGVGFQNCSSPPEVMTEADVTGRFFAGIRISPNVSIGYGLITLSVPVDVGAEINAKFSLLHPSDADEGHACSKCIKGTVDGVVRISVKLDVNLFGSQSTRSAQLGELREELFPFYYSFDIGWGKGECPNYRAKPAKIQEDIAEPDLPTAPSVPSVPSGGTATAIYNGGDSLTITGSGTLDDDTLTTAVDNHEAYIYSLYKNGLIDENTAKSLYISSNTIRYTTISGFSAITANLGGNVTVTGNTKWVYLGFSGVKSLSLPDTVEYLNLRHCDFLTQINLPRSLKRIGKYAFQRCYYLTSITIPENVEYIDDSAFDFCTGLTSITIPETVEYVGNYAFKGCTGLKSATVNAKYIGSHVFDACTGLTSLTVNAEHIGQSAFSGCPGLTSVTLSDSVRYIDSAAFSGCTELTSLTVNAEHIGQSAFSGCTGLTSVTLQDGVRYIDGAAFSGCTGLKSITIPESVEVMERNIFSGCSNLKSAVLLSETPCAFNGCEALERVTIGSGVKKIGDYAFSRCTSLKSVTIPSSVTTIGMAAFAGAGLTRIDIPTGVTTIGDRAFEHCESLTRVTVPESVTELYYNTFANCTALTRVDLPDTLTGICSGAFNNCTALRRVTLPSSLVYMAEPVFSGCRSLTDVYYQGTEDEWNDIIIGWGYNGSVDFPTHLDEVYQHNISSMVAPTELHDTPKEGSYYERYVCTALRGYRGLSGMDFDVYRQSELDAYIQYVNNAFTNYGYTETAVTYEYLTKYYRNSTGKETPPPMRAPYSGYNPYQNGVTVHCKDVKASAASTGMSEGVSLADGDTLSFSGLTPDTEYLLTVEPTDGGSLGGEIKYLAQTASDTDGCLTVTVSGSFDRGAYCAYLYGACSHAATHYEELSSGGQILVCDVCHKRLTCIVTDGAVPPAFGMTGDADGDGDVSTVDVTYIQRACALMNTGIDEDVLMNADVDCNGELEIIDATYIQRWLAHIDIPYEIGE